MKTCDQLILERLKGTQLHFENEADFCGAVSPSAAVWYLAVADGLEPGHRVGLVHAQGWVGGGGVNPTHAPRGLQQVPPGHNQQVWPLTQFFFVSFL